MKKKLIVISEGKLIKNGSASDTVMCGLVDEALNLQYDVSYIYLKDKDKANLKNEEIIYTNTCSFRKFKFERTDPYLGMYECYC